MKKNSPLKRFFHRIDRIERKSYNFYSNLRQILHLLAIFSGDTSTREEKFCEDDLSGHSLESTMV